MVITSRQKEILFLFGIVTFCCIVHCLIYWKQDRLMIDSVYYINLIKEITTSSQSSLSVNYVAPPLLLLATIAGHKLGLSVELAGSLFCILCSSFLPVALFLFGKKLFFRKSAAYLAAFLALIHPYFLKFGSQTLRDGPYWTFFAFSLFFIINTFQKNFKQTLINWLAVGLFTGLAITTRKEGLELILFIAFYVLFFQFPIEKKGFLKKQFFFLINIIIFLAILGLSCGIIYLLFNLKFGGNWQPLQNNAFDRFFYSKLFMIKQQLLSETTSSQTKETAKALFTVKKLFLPWNRLLSSSFIFVPVFCCLSYFRRDLFKCSRALSFFICVGSIALAWRLFYSYINIEANSPTRYFVLLNIFLIIFAVPGVFMAVSFFYNTLCGYFNGLKEQHVWIALLAIIAAISLGKELRPKKPKLFLHNLSKIITACCPNVSPNKIFLIETVGEKRRIEYYFPKLKGQVIALTNDNALSAKFIYKSLKSSPEPIPELFLFVRSYTPKALSRELKYILGKEFGLPNNAMHLVKQYPFRKTNYFLYKIEFTQPWNYPQIE